MTSSERRSNVASLEQARRRAAERTSVKAALTGPARGATARRARPDQPKTSTGAAGGGSARAGDRGGHPAGRSAAAQGKTERRRIASLFVVVLLCAGVIVVRLVHLQGLTSSRYRELANEQRLRSEELLTPRGDILDRDGMPLAITVMRKTVVADPAAITDPKQTANLLSEALKIDAGEILPKLIGESRFAYIARTVDDEAAARVAGLGLTGISLVDEPRRHYPGGALAANVLGFVGRDGEGLAGIELQAEELLAGRPGQLLVEQDPQGRPIPQAEYRYEAPLPGRDTFLTLDSEIQFQAERILADAVAQYRAKGGAILVLDVENGEILAMANNPTFDPNEYWRADPEARKNRLAVDVYEPGSTNKVITAAAALEEQIVSLDEKFAVPGRIKVADSEFSDAEEHGTYTWNLREILVNSSNVGTIRVAQRLGSERLDQYLRSFGYGEPTGVGIPGEAPGLLIPVEKWWGTSIATVPIGQGIAVTGLQLAGVYATVANDGVWTAPRLVRGPRGEDGAPVDNAPVVGKRVVSSETARTLREILGGAVAEGTGRRAAVAGHQVGGKTGTARKPSEGGGYSDAYISSFVGFAPVEKPRVVTAVILDEPTPYYGGLTAAPTFSRLMTFVLHHLDVPPSGEQAALAKGPYRPVPAEQAPPGIKPGAVQTAAAAAGSGKPSTNSAAKPAATPAAGSSQNRRR